MQAIVEVIEHHSVIPAWGERGAGRVRALIQEHYRFVWRSLRRLGVAEADIDDAVQQVFLVMAKKIDDVEDSKERSFLFGTVVRVASGHRRTLRRRRETLDGDVPEQQDMSSGPEDLVERRNALALLDSIIDAMPEELKAVFVLYEIEEMQMSEIAQWIGIPMGTVASRLRRAREEFQSRAEQMRTKDIAGRQA